MAISSERKGKIMCITINRPEVMNALDHEHIEELRKAFSDFRDDPELWVCILTGAGDKAFCAGADMTKVIGRKINWSPDSKADPDTTDPISGYYELNIWKPMIAAINGFCLAGGLGIALVCDIRICSENATFGTMGTSRGILPGAAQTQTLPRVIPLAKALELFFTAERIDAQEAYRLGLVNKVVPQAELMKAAWEMAEKIAKNAPLAVYASKQACINGLDLSLGEGIALEANLREKLFSTEDAAEGVAAFREKRQPNFKGR
jgi:enoyl-CoA hydratase/carnithine racemase